jgi:hypothetical protein
VTFKNGPCTETYDHSHSVTGGSPKACGAGGKEALEALAKAKDAPKPKSDADKASDARKDAKAAEDAEATASAKTAKKAAAFVQIESKYVNKGWGSTTPGPGPPALTFKNEAGDLDEYDHSHSRSAAMEKWTGKKQPEDEAKVNAKKAQEEMKGPAEEKTEPDAEEKKKEEAKKEAAKDAPPAKAKEETPAPKKVAAPKAPEGPKLKDEVYDDINTAESKSKSAEEAAKVVEGEKKDEPEPKKDEPEPKKEEAAAAFA